MKRKIERSQFNPKKTKYIDIIYSQFDSDSDDGPEWLPPESDSDSQSDSGSASESDSKTISTSGSVSDSKSQ